MEELKTIRERLGISQIEAANIANISRRSYQMYESDPSKKDTMKYEYLTYKLKRLSKLDEEHGLLTLDGIKRIVSSVLNKYDVKSCYLFGSYSRGEAKETSDVDLLIDTTVTGLDFFGLVEELRVALCKKVDLLDLKQLANNMELASNILKDGIKIYG